MLNLLSQWSQHYRVQSANSLGAIATTLWHRATQIAVYRFTRKIGETENTVVKKKLFVKFFLLLQSHPDKCAQASWSPLPVGAPWQVGVSEAKSSSFTELKLPAFKPKYPSTNNVKIVKYNELFAKSIIHTSDLPFCLKSTADEIITLLLSVSGETNKKKVLREAIRKWHPDKFIQMFSEKIDKHEFNDVIAIVNHVSQTLLLYGK